MLRYPFGSIGYCGRALKLKAGLQIHSLAEFDNPKLLDAVKDWGLDSQIWSDD